MRKQKKKHSSSNVKELPRKMNPQRKKKKKTALLGATKYNKSHDQ